MLNKGLDLYEMEKCQEFCCITIQPSAGERQNFPIQPIQRTYSWIVGHNYSFYWGLWASPDGTAMSGQPMRESEQAPALYPLTKISLISKRTHGSHIRY